MSETIEEKLAWVIPLLEKAWVIPLLQKWLDGDELRTRDTVDSDIWWPWQDHELPKFDGPQENYRVLPPWAWKLVDAEKAGKTIQFKSLHDGDWVDIPTKVCKWNLSPGCYQIKPDPEPIRAQLTEADFDIGWWEIHWKGGEKSKAVISRDRDGNKCIACANWVTGPVRLSSYIYLIDDAYLVLTTDDSTDARE